MTKEEIVGLFMESVSGNRPTDDQLGLHEDLLAGYLSVAMQRLVHLAVKSDPQGKYRILSNYTYVERGIKAEPKDKEGSYILKPSKRWISLPGQEGVRSVYPSGNPREALAYRNVTAISMMGTLHDAMGNHSKGEYIAMPGLIQIFNSPGKCETFDVAMVADIVSLDWDDEVMLPEGGQKELFDMAKEMYLQSPPPDLINDGK